MPFWFVDRRAGQGKESFRQASRLTLRLQRLWSEGGPLRFARFLVVGASALLINSLLLAFWTEVFGIYYLISAVLATEGATLCGFCLTEFWVFARRRPRQGRGRRFVMFLLMNNVVLVLRGPLIYALTTGLGLHYLASNVISVVVMTLIRYALADTWIWRMARAAEAGPDLPAPGRQGLAGPDRGRKNAGASKGGVQ